MRFEQFKALHHNSRSPLLICNVWDVASAKTAEKLGFTAMGTSSAAIAATLGYEDGEQMSFDQLSFVVQRITACSQLPLSVDIESGYSEDPKITAAHISKLAQMGVVGINIEDSHMQSTRTLIQAERFASYLTAIKSQLVEDNIDIFLNVRSDSFLLAMPDALAQTIERAGLYHSAGADGLFVPCITQVQDIRSLAAATKLPLNVMCMPELSNFDTLAANGVKRISMGNFLFDKLQSHLECDLKLIQKQQSFHSVFAAVQS
ncbi:isocitrate lyase/phosphoenolpyruvate mutase family protein [Alginatibacterium sediminis]|uniref:Isocitrate lyase/phosphoenolpyruvate mutase family protein n=1 Tax=Alginatibacterium sediminis TaxID=2164068 RepID=A0A420EDI4_9ALTE|nr:isocitrate lyase/phosphoenolpyruvate mutase family protein [Alginatibacterium sediminis]RKF18726.1 isocitrate lyase/phosphoenolpyruvate mutase family protein [Alginatibacterium sediminis]